MSRRTGIPDDSSDWAEIRSRVDDLELALRRSKLSVPTKYAGPSGGATRTVTAQVALAGGPSITVDHTALYMVRISLAIQSGAAGVFAGNAVLGVDGAPSGIVPGVFVSGDASGDGGTLMREGAGVLTEGQVLTIRIFNSTTVSTTYASGYMSIQAID